METEHEGTETITAADEERAANMALAKKMVEEHDAAMAQMKAERLALFAKLGVTQEKDEPPSKKRKREDETSSTGSSSKQKQKPSEDLLEYHVSQDLSQDDSHQGLEEDVVDNGLLTTTDSLEDTGEELNEQELEDLVSSTYKSMLDTVEEELGDPISNALANACKRTFGQVILDANVK